MLRAARDCNDHEQHDHGDRVESRFRSAAHERNRLGIGHSVRYEPTAEPMRPTRSFEIGYSALPLPDNRATADRELTRVHAVL